jgi:hypothetical protein
MSANLFPHPKGNMTIRELHKLTGDLLATNADDPVAINYRTFLEPEEPSHTILEIESAEVRNVQGADDSGPVGDEYPFLVLSGPVHWHTHGDPI